jgi:hypothetical protein
MTPTRACLRAAPVSAPKASNLPGYECMMCGGAPGSLVGT